MKTCLYLVFSCLFCMSACSDDGAGTIDASSALDAPIPDAATQIDAPDPMLDAAPPVDAPLADAPMADAMPPVDAAPGSPMVAVPAGVFIMGCNTCDADESPAHGITLSDFEIDVTEVTQGAYELCVAAGACTPPSGNYDPVGTPMHPVVNVTWSQSLGYCQWVGKRLPTEAEWEKAARGTDGRVYPWGNDAIDDCTRANTSACGGMRQPVGQLPLGASPYGALDMAGNVWEWVSDYYAADTYQSHKDTDPQGPATGTTRVYRGGSSGNAISLARASNRANTYNPSVGGSGLGFRCAR